MAEEDREDASVKEDRLDQKTVDEGIIIKNWYRKQAKDQHEVEGTIEVDEHADVSLGGEPGAYIQAWVWVDNPNCSSCEEPIKELEVNPEDRRFVNRICPQCREDANSEEKESEKENSGEIGFRSEEKPEA